ncbi:MAG: HAD family hydrolase [Aggregatilineales bacterium]
MISCVFFEPHSILIDSATLKTPYRHAVARYMTATYGGEFQQWDAAQQQIETHRREYYIDLNLSDDDDLQDYHEGLFRVARALFTLTNIPEPIKPEITTLSKKLPTLDFDAPGAIFPDVIPALTRLSEQGIQIGLITHALTEQATTILNAAGIRQFFTAPIIGVDTAEQFEKNSQFFACVLRLANVPAEQCLIVDTRPEVITAAKHTGMQACLYQRAHPDSLDLDKFMRDYVPIRKPTSKIAPKRR